MKNRWLSVSLVALLVCATGAWAQEIFGTITGNVLDSTGAAIPGAKVTVKSMDKGLVVREVVSGPDGFYAVPKLAIGRYSLTIEATGFKKVTISDIELNVAEIYRSDVTMHIGSIVETVTVEAAALQVETESAIAGTLISGALVRELSLNNRNYQQLVSLSPGVSYGGGDQLKSTDIAKAIIQAHPNLKGFFGANEGSIIGVLNAAKELNMAGKLVIIGYDAGKQQKDAIRSGLEAGAITQDPIGIGYKCVEAAVKAMKGESVPKNIDTGFKWYDKSNIDDPDIAPLLYD